MKFRKIKLIECCISISDGDHQPPPKANSGIPFITISDINENNQIDFSNTMCVSSEYYDSLDIKRKVQKNDVLYSVVGSFGKPVFISENKKFVFQRHIAILRANEDILMPKYLYYSLMNPLFYKRADKYAIGAAQRTISLDSLRNLEINVPSINDQNNLVSILEKLDKKISYNININDNLEQMALDVYMHTFLSKTTTGKLSDIIIENEKSTIQVGDAKSNTGSIPFFTSGDAILTWSSSIVSGRNCYLNTGGNADVKFYVGEAAYSTDTWCISACDNMSDYLYLLLLSIKLELNKKYFQGTGLKHLQKPLLRDRNIYVPSKSELIAFNSIVQPAFSTISENIRENNELIQLRDWLLPMLMNGQVSISD